MLCRTQPYFVGEEESSTRRYAVGRAPMIFFFSRRGSITRLKKAIAVKSGSWVPASFSWSKTNADSLIAVPFEGQLAVGGITAALAGADKNKFPLLLDIHSSAAGHHRRWAFLFHIDGIGEVVFKMMPAVALVVRYHTPPLVVAAYTRCEEGAPFHRAIPVTLPLMAPNLSPTFVQSTAASSYFQLSTRSLPGAKVILLTICFPFVSQGMGWQWICPWGASERCFINSHSRAPGRRLARPGQERKRIFTKEREKVPK